MIARNRPRENSLSRPAFTLMELLIVIVIIGGLTTLVVAAAIRVASGQKQSNTETGMTAIYRVLQQQWEAVVDEAKKETDIPQSVRDFANGAPGTFDPTGERAKIIWIKMRLMEAFPISYNEILNSALYSGTNPYIPAGRRKYLASMKTALGGKTSANVPSTEPSACLLLALQQSRGGGAFSMDNFGPYISDTDGDGVKEFIDAWKGPLVFYRFPSQNDDLQAANPNPSATYWDPLDPKGLLVQSNWNNAVEPTSMKTYGALYEQLVATRIVWNGKAAFTIPAIVSAGSDVRDAVPFTAPYGTADAKFKTALGADIVTMQVTPAGNLNYNDTIASYRLKLSGRAD